MVTFQNNVESAWVEAHNEAFGAQYNWNYSMSSGFMPDTYRNLGISNWQSKMTFLNQRIPQIRASMDAAQSKALEDSRNAERVNNDIIRAGSPNTAQRRPGEGPVVVKGEKEVVRIDDVIVTRPRQVHSQPIIPVRVSPGLMQKIEDEGLSSFKNTPAQVSIFTDVVQIEIPMLWNPLARGVEEIGNKLISLIKEEKYGWKVLSIGAEDGNLKVELIETGSVAIGVILALIYAGSALLGIKLSADAIVKSFDSWKVVKVTQEETRQAAINELPPEEAVIALETLKSEEPESVADKVGGFVGDIGKGAGLAIVAGLGLMMLSK